MPKLTEVSEEYFNDLLAIRAIVKVLVENYMNGKNIGHCIGLLKLALEETEDSDAHKLENLAEGMKDSVSPPTSQGE